MVVTGLALLSLVGAVIGAVIGGLLGFPTWSVVGFGLVCGWLTALVVALVATFTIRP